MPARLTGHTVSSLRKGERHESQNLRIYRRDPEVIRLLADLAQEPAHIGLLQVAVQRHGDLLDAVLCGQVHAGYGDLVQLRHIDKEVEIACRSRAGKGYLHLRVIRGLVNPRGLRRAVHHRILHGRQFAVLVSSADAHKMAQECDILVIDLLVHIPCSLLNDGDCFIERDLRLF